TGIVNQFTASLWGDEAFSAVLSMKSIPEIISIIARDTSPPLYNISEHFWFGLFGTSEVAIRALSFLYFLIAIFFVYKIGKHLWDKKTGLLASALTFFNPFFFAYAFEGRMYSILAAGVSASMYFFVKRNWVGYVLATTAALYSHHFAIFAVFIQFLWFLKEYLWGKKKIAISILKSFVAIGVLYSPWLLPLYGQTKLVGGGFWLGTPPLKDLGKLFLTYLNICLIALVVRKWGENFEKALFLLSWFFGPILITWLISQKFTSIFFDRYLLYIIPAAMLLAASQRRKISLLAIAITMVLFIWADLFYFTHPIKRPFRELATYVRQSRRGDDYLINWNSSAHHLWEAKYYGIPAPLYIPEGTKLPFYVGTALMTDTDVTSSLPKKLNRVGVITSGPIEEIMISDYTKSEDKTFGSLKFVWFERKK
ncbi:MAG: glycosyltransferase family 39 protein, partial [Patescibacteria group bacterium]